MTRPLPKKSHVWVAEMLSGGEWMLVEKCRSDRRRARYLVADWAKLYPWRRYRVAKYERVFPSPGRGRK